MSEAEGLEMVSVSIHECPDPKRDLWSKMEKKQMEMTTPKTESS